MYDAEIGVEEITPRNEALLDVIKEKEKMLMLLKECKALLEAENTPCQLTKIWIASWRILCRQDCGQPCCQTP